MDDFEKKLKKGFWWYDAKKTIVQIVLIIVLAFAAFFIIFSVYSLWKPFDKWENIDFGIFTALVTVFITSIVSIVVKIISVRNDKKIAIIEKKEDIYIKLLNELTNFYKNNHNQYLIIQDKLEGFFSKNLTEILLYCSPGVANRCCRLWETILITKKKTSKKYILKDEKEEDKKQQAILVLIPEIINAIRKDFGVSEMGEEILRSMLH